MNSKALVARSYAHLGASSSSRLHSEVSATIFNVPSLAKKNNKGRQASFHLASKFTFKDFRTEPASKNPNGAHRRLTHRRLMRSTPTSSASALQDIGEESTVGDLMSKMPLVWCTPTTSVEEALSMIVESRITGMPVLDEQMKVVGIVSDYDLLALDSLIDICDTEEFETNGNCVGGMFPSLEQSWTEFNTLQSMIDKSRGQQVYEVMTEDPVVVTADSNLSVAIKVLFRQKVRRVPVVNENMELVGVLSRGNVIRAALQTRRGMAASEQEKLGI